MSLTQYSHGFPNGVSLLGVPVVNMTASNVLWVDSNYGNAGNPGTIDLPINTIANAITRLGNLSSTGDRVGNTLAGSVIFCKPNHAESLTAATTYSQAGLLIQGIHNGIDDMPTITFPTAAVVGANVLLGAVNMAISGIKIVDSKGVTSPLVLGADGCKAIGNRIVDGSQSFVSGITVLAGLANGADKCVISDNYIYSAGATNGILLGEVDDQVVIENNTIIGSYSTAAIQNPTATVMTLLQVNGNNLTNTHATGRGINIVSASTGEIYDNNIAVTVLGSEIVLGTAGSIKTAGNTGTSTSVPNSSYPIPVVSNVAPSPSVTAVSAIKVIPQTATTTVFTVTGGPILLEYLAAEVTTVVQTQACNFKFTSTDTASTTATDICANLNITAAAVGTFLWVKGDALATALQATAGGTGLGPTSTTNLVIPAGTVAATTSASNTGNIKYRIKYTPLAPGAYVTLS